LPVISIVFILNLGSILSAGFDQVFNLYNPLVYGVGDIIDTYVYRIGLVKMQYSLSTAVNLFKNGIGLGLVLLTNIIVRKIGDGEHGTSMNRGFTAVIEKLPELEDKCIGTILKTVGLTLLSTVGGASGALYGSAFLSAGNRMIGKKELTLIDIIEIFNVALEVIYKYGKAKMGDKTMVDTLAPVVEYLNSKKIEKENFSEIVVKIKKIAKQGMEGTKPLIAHKGRASYLKERSIGHLDPGAVSCYFLINTFVSEL
jgi:dihydroxyacetone kinase-like protein